MSLFPLFHPEICLLYLVLTVSSRTVCRLVTKNVTENYPFFFFFFFLVQLPDHCRANQKIKHIVVVLYKCLLNTDGLEA